MASQPTLFRPPVRFLPATSGLKGFLEVMSSFVVTDMKRRLGVDGLKFLIPMVVYTASKYSTGFSPGLSVT